jgi:hypothetical protein
VNERVSLIHDLLSKLRHCNRDACASAMSAALNCTVTSSLCPPAAAIRFIACFAEMRHASYRSLAEAGAPEALAPSALSPRSVIVTNKAPRFNPTLQRKVWLPHRRLEELSD